MPSEFALSIHVLALVGMLVPACASDGIHALVQSTGFKALRPNHLARQKQGICLLQMIGLPTDTRLVRPFVPNFVTS